jgi:hypothetical protein
MQLDPKTSPDQNYGFVNPEAGTYLWEIDEKIAIFMKDEVRDGDMPGPKFLMVPLKIVGVIEGDAKEGGQASLFITLITKSGDVNGFGETQVQGLLAATGTLEELLNKVGDKDFSPADSAPFAQFIATKLPGKVIQATHEINVGSDGKERVNFTNVKNAPGASGSAASSGKQGAVEENADDWN